MNFDITVHVAELLTIIAAAFFVVRAANRVWYLLKDYPPHRHVNGSIVYPPDFEPTKVQALYPQGKS